MSGRDDEEEHSMKKHVLLGATVALLLDVSLAHALPANQSLHIDRGRLSATLAGAPLGELASEVRKAGIPVTFTEPALAARQIHVDLKDVAIEEGLRRILRDNYVMAFRRVNGESVLASVIIGDRSKMGDTKSKVKTIAYGNGKGQVGVLRGGAGAHAGPASFFADSQGRRVICDSVNGRILVLDTNGEEVSAFSLKDFKADDVMSDASGNIFVFDVSGKIRQFDSTGLEIAQASVGDQSWLTRGPMRIVGDGVYVRVDGQSDRRVANLVDGRLQTLPEGLNAVSEAGQLGTSGRAYLANVDSNGRSASLAVAQGGQILIEKDIPLQGILSVEFLGEDQSGNFYAKTEAEREGQLVVEVSRFSPEGDYLASMTVPGMDYAFWSMRTVSIDSGGRVHQMMPGKDALTLSTYEFQ